MKDIYKISKDANYKYYCTTCRINPQNTSSKGNTKTPRKSYKKQKNSKQGKNQGGSNKGEFKVLGKRAGGEIGAEDEEEGEACKRLLMLNNNGMLSMILWIVYIYIYIYYIYLDGKYDGEVIKRKKGDKSRRVVAPFFDCYEYDGTL